MAKLKAEVAIQIIMGAELATNSILWLYTEALFNDTDIDYHILVPISQSG